MVLQAAGPRAECGRDRQTGSFSRYVWGPVVCQAWCQVSVQHSWAGWIMDKPEYGDLLMGGGIKRKY